MGRGKRTVLGADLLPLRRVKTTILHGLQDTVISPDGSRRFVEELLRRDPEFPVTLLLPAGDHRLSSPEHLETFRRLVVEKDRGKRMFVLIHKECGGPALEDRRSAKSVRFRWTAFRFPASVAWKRSSTNRKCGCRRSWAFNRNPKIILESTSVATGPVAATTPSCSLHPSEVHPVIRRIRTSYV